MVTTAGPKPVLSQLHSDSCDSDSSDNASDSDSSDAPLAKKKCRGIRPAMPVPHVPASRPASKYNIWGSVLQEQTLSKDLGSWFGMNSKVKSDRDVETYDYRKAKDANMNDDNGADDAANVDIADDCDESRTDGDNVNICDHETFGTSTDNNHASASEQDRCDDELPSRKRKRNDLPTAAVNNRQLPSDVAVNREHARNRVSRRTYDREKFRSHVLAGANDTSVTVAQELIRLLGEPEHMKDMFGNSHETTTKPC